MWSWPRTYSAILRSCRTVNFFSSISSFSMMLVYSSSCIAPRVLIISYKRLRFLLILQNIIMLGNYLIVSFPLSILFADLLFIIRGSLRVRFPPSCQQYLQPTLMNWVHFGCKIGVFSPIFPYFPKSKKKKAFRGIIP